MYILDPEGEKIVKAVKEGKKRGISIIVYNETSRSTLRDATEMEYTLHDVFKFHTIMLRNPNEVEIKTKIQKISSAFPLLGEDTPANFKAIVFVFSGHGSYSDTTFSGD